MMETMHLSLRAALAENRLEDFVRQAMARGLEFSRGSEFERGLALLLVQRKRDGERRTPVLACASPARKHTTKMAGTNPAICAFRPRLFAGAKPRKPKPTCP